MVFGNKTVFIFIGIITLFLFLRLHKLEESFLFYADMGRDFVVLQEWQRTGKPPLLGPQTSALAFNQSAVYFYILFPFFILTKHSLYSTLYAVLTIYSLGFLTGFWFLKNNKFLLKVLFSLSVLISLHPQFITQQRFIWNPSFVPLCMAFASISFYMLLEKWSRKRLAILLVSLAGATAFSFSTVPIIASFFVVLVLKRKDKWLELFLGFPLFIALAHAPTIFFEFRHKILLSQLSRTVTAKEIPPLLDRLKTLLYVFLGAGPTTSSLILLLVLTLAFLAVLREKQYRDKIWQSKTALLITVFALSVVFTLFAPVALFPHFTLGLITLLLSVIAFLPLRSAVLAGLLCLALWLRPTQLQTYYRPVHRTAAQTESCAQAVCKNEQEPLFLTVTAGSHPYHTGYEFRYLFRENGCSVPDIEKDPTAAEKMAVVVDDSVYEHNKTSYHELTQFGESSEERIYHCMDRLKVHILERKK